VNCFKGFRVPCSAPATRRRRLPAATTRGTGWWKSGREKPSWPGTPGSLKSGDASPIFYNSLRHKDLQDVAGRRGHGCPQVSSSLACPPLAGSPYPVPAFAPLHGCPQVSGSLFPVPRSPLLGVIHNGVCPCGHVKTIKFGSKSIKRATDSDQKRSKQSAIRHAHLNILGGHPLWR